MNTAEAPAGTSAPAGIARPALFWGLAFAVLVVDAATKAIAVEALGPGRPVVPVIGDLLRWTLVYNPGAAFGMSFGPWSRWIFMGLTGVALLVLWSLYRGAAPRDHLRVLACSLVSGGALGNLVDRVRSPRGVVDFIDVGFGDARWPTFNVADMAVSTGAVLLALVLWREDARAAATDAVPSADPLRQP